VSASEIPLPTSRILPRSGSRFVQESYSPERSVRATVFALPWSLGYKTGASPDDHHTLRFLTPFHTYTSLRTVQTHLCLCAKYCGVSTLLSTDRTDTYVKYSHPPEKKSRFWEDDDDDQEKTILGGHARNRTIKRCASLPRSTRTLLCGPYRHICDCAQGTGVFERTCLQTEQIQV